MRLKKITLENLKDASKTIDCVELAMTEALFAKPNSLEEHICQRYIENQNVSDLAKELNHEGYRVGGRKYLGKDVSEVIKGSEESKITEFAKALFHYNNTLQNGKTSFRKFAERLGKGDAK